jgi:hypothetical protein
MPGHRRPKDGVLSHTYAPGIHVFGLCEEQDVDGIESGGPASARNDEAHIG